MSGMEIERKFLVKHGEDFRRAAYASSHIRQAYMPCESATVRVRIRDNEAYLTIKSRSTDNGLSRYEFETKIDVAEAEQLLKLCRGGMIDKRRYLVKSGSHTFEVDEFYGDNEGLRMAEVELSAPDEPFEKPSFLGPEVTGDRHFYNSHLLTNPYRLWRDAIPEAYR